MASLYIKDAATAALAGKVATRLGTTKTEAVRRGLAALAPDETVNTGVAIGSTADWLRQYRSLYPLPDREALKLAKAFYDSLSDEEDVFDPWSD